MSDFVFFELKPDVAQKLHLPPLPVPVRRERQMQVFPEGGDADFAGMLDELNVFLGENPHQTEAYRQFLAMLCYIVGVDASTKGFHAQAAHYFQLGLDAVPESVSLRSHYGLSLHCAERYVEARRQYERVVETTPKDKILPVMWMMLARIYARDGEYEKAYWLLKDVSTLIPDEPGFWDFLGALKEKAGIRDEPQPAPAVAPQEFTVAVASQLGGDAFARPPAPAPAPAPPHAPAPEHPAPEHPAPEHAADAPVRCTWCGATVPSSAKFCLKCGTKVESPPAADPTVAPAVAEAPRPAFCANCGTPPKPGAKFCMGCGARLP